MAATHNLSQVAAWTQTSVADGVEVINSRWEATHAGKAIEVVFCTIGAPRYGWSVWGAGGLHIAGGYRDTLGQAQATAIAKAEFYSVG
ncbi:hypothetical protein SEA_LIGMA_68 [Gordonia phage Ligma]|nr:hypothetical protein SEA_LIGMA_68 [Gordonia phage Ligma]UQT02167.1 hypothetical protein SEA_AXUMITE_68 [Gordonia phage Axumite]